MLIFTKVSEICIPIYSLPKFHNIFHNSLIISTLHMFKNNILPHRRQPRGNDRHPGPALCAGPKCGGPLWRRTAALRHRHGLRAEGGRLHVRRAFLIP